MTRIGRIFADLFVLAITRADPLDPRHPRSILIGDKVKVGNVLRFPNFVSRKRVHLILLWIHKLFGHP